jgi:hypothetical protein
VFTFNSDYAVRIDMVIIPLLAEAAQLIPDIRVPLHHILPWHP